MDCHVFVIMDTIMTWNVWNAILLGGVCELIACPVCNLFVSFLVLMEITMTGMMKLMMFIVIAMKGPGAWFYSQPLLQTVCFTKELYRVSLRLNMIYTNLHHSCLFIFSLSWWAGYVQMWRDDFAGQHFSDLIGAFLNTGASPPPTLADGATFGSFEFRFTNQNLLWIISIMASLENSMAHLSWWNLNCILSSTIWAAVIEVEELVKLFQLQACAELLLTRVY